MKSTLPARRALAALAAGALALAIAMPATAQNPAYEQALEDVFQLTYGKELTSLNVDEMVEAFAKGAKGKAEQEKCPALVSTIDSFADVQVRKAVTDYFSSPSLKAAIKDEMRKHYAQAELEAFLAFARSPAGTRFLAQQQKADAAVARTVKERTEAIAESPEFTAMMGDMMAKMLPVMLQCQKDRQ